jgi:hypothetical protein
VAELGRLLKDGGGPVSVGLDCLGAEDREGRQGLDPTGGTGEIGTAGLLGGSGEEFRVASEMESG